MCLCHDENQKRWIIHEEEQERKGTAQRRKTKRGISVFGRVLAKTPV